MLRTRSKVRVMGRDDLPAVRKILDQDPITHVFVDHRVRSTNLDPRWLGGQLWGYDDGNGVVALCHSAANLIPVGATPDALRAFATQALVQGRQCSAILGQDDDVHQMWEVLSPDWGPARDIRARQPFLTLRAAPLVPPDPRVQRVRADQLDALYPACVAMFTEELGVSPEAGGGARLYRSRIAQLISRGLAFAWIDGDEVVFKAEVAAVTPHAAQVQGVWVNPAYRGQGQCAGGAQRERQRAVGERALDALRDVVVRDVAVQRVRRELRVDREHRVEDVARAERGQHGLERIVERQQVRGAAAGAEREHGLAAQRVGRQQVEEGLEQAAVRGLVDGRGDDHQARRGDLFTRAADGRVVDVRTHQRGGRKVAQHDLGARLAVGEAGQDVAEQGGRTGIRRRTAGECNDGHATGVAL